MKTANEYENRAWQLGELVVGIDEAGRGPLAGPLVVAGVVFPAGYDSGDINDSKQLSEKKRERLYDVIIRDALFYQIEIPGCEGAARFCAFWETTAQRLQQTLQTQGVDFGRQCLEDYLDTGGKRSRFACPRFFLRIAEVKEELSQG